MWLNGIIYLNGQTSIELLQRKLEKIKRKMCWFNLQFAEQFESLEGIKYLQNLFQVTFKIFATTINANVLIFRECSLQKFLFIPASPQWKILSHLSDMWLSIHLTAPSRSQVDTSSKQKRPKDACAGKQCTEIIAPKKKKRKERKEEKKGFGLRLSQCGAFIKQGKKNWLSNMRRSVR